MSERSDLTDLSIAELNERMEATGDDDFGETRREALTEELERRESEREELKELLSMKTELARAEEYGLGGDPTVEALSEHVEELDAALHPSPQSALAEEAGVSIDLVDGLSDEEADQASTHVQSIEMLAGSSNAASKVGLEEHAEALQELLADHDVEPEALTESAVVEEPGVSIEALYEDLE